MLLDSRLNCWRERCWLWWLHHLKSAAWESGGLLGGCDRSGHCKLHNTIQELNALKGKIADPRSILATLTTKQQTNPVKENQPSLQSPIPIETIAPMTNLSTSITVGPPSIPQSQLSTASNDKRLNLVMYGVQENPKGTRRHVCNRNDLDNCLCVLKDINPDISSNPVRDCTHLGKFSESSPRPRPLLLTFVASINVSKVLSNRKNYQPIKELQSSPSYHCKNDK
jgi:hypothetical protein